MPAKRGSRQCDAHAQGGVVEPTISHAPAIRLEPACLTVEETAAYIRVSRQTAYAMARDGRLPVVHPVRKRTLVVKAKLDALLADGTLGAVIVKPAAGDSPTKS